MPTTEYRTGHRYLAAYLIAKDHFLLRHETDNGYVSFIFSDDGKLQELVEEFYQNTGFVHPQDFIHGIESTRSIIRDQRSGADQQGGRS